jgi:hypothetical protein
VKAKGLRTVIGLLLAVSGGLAWSTTLDSLLGSDQLRLQARLQPEQGVVVGQEVRLTVEVATRRWFAGGTRLRPPDIPNLVILQRDQFATNQTRREAGTTWVVQQWHLELYPRRAGTFELPPVTVSLAINDAEAGVVSGELQTPPLAFTAGIPPGAEAIDDWLATPAMTIEHRVEGPLEGLEPGAAVVREILLSATHVTAMMLPTSRVGAPEGLAVYADTPRLRDRSNRGEAIAERRERLTYMVERAGDYVIPEQVFHWWDTGSGQMREAVLPELVIAAGGAGAAALAGQPTASAAWLQPAPLWLAVIFGLLALLLMARNLPTSKSPPGQARQLRSINRALRRGDSAAASRLLYAWLNSEQPAPDWLRLRVALARQLQGEDRDQLEAVLGDAYGSDRRAATQSLKIRRPGRLSGIAQRVTALLRPRPLELNPGSNAAARKASGRP